MKKRFLLLGLSVSMCAFALTGCGGSSKKNFISDIEEVVETNDKLNEYSLSDTDEIKKAQDVIKDMDVKTDEGKQLKEDYEELFQLLYDVYEISDDENAQEDQLDELEEKYDEIEEKIDKDADAFIDAAEDAGVKDSDIDKLTNAI